MPSVTYLDILSGRTSYIFQPRRLAMRWGMTSARERTAVAGKRGGGGDLRGEPIARLEVARARPAALVDAVLAALGV